MKKLTEIARFTPHLDAMIEFYEALLGTAPAVRAEGMAIFMLGETKLFLHRSYTPKEDELPPEDHLAFTVADVDATCAELAVAGLKVEVPPREYYWGYSAYLRDPDGKLIELIAGDEG
jgi:catechol 2,3-dioxygenase-like lactoylglutathione lyase family enzyme